MQLCLLIGDEATKKDIEAMGYDGSCLQCNERIIRFTHSDDKCSVIQDFKSQLFD